MKKYLLMAGMALGMAASAAAVDAPAFVWGNLLDGATAAGDNATNQVVAPDHNVYWMGIYGSNEAQSLDITYAGSTLFTGASYTGTSNNGNFTLLKTDADGHKIWVVYSNSGDFASNVGGVAATSDGGCVFAAKVRHTDGHNDAAINIVDASGAVSSFNWTEGAEDSRQYQLVVGKVSAEGSLVWTRVMECSKGNDEENVITDAFTVAAPAVDVNDNIYLAMGLTTDISVPAADGSQKVLAANPDAVVKNGTYTTCLTLALDKDGYYAHSLIPEGVADDAKFQSVLWADGYLYVQGLVKAAEGTLKVGDYSFAPGSYTSVLLMRLDSNLTPDWVKCLKMTEVSGTGTAQNIGLTVNGSNLWVCGMFNGCLNDDSDSSKSVTSEGKSPREGFIIKLNAEDGKWVAARDSRDDAFDKPSAAAKTGLTGYLKVIQGPEATNRIYVYGYVMNATVGVFLREYDADTLEANLESGQHNIVTGGGVPTACDIAFDAASADVYLTARGNKAFTIEGCNEDLTPTAWGVLLACFHLPEDMSTNVSGIALGDADDAEAEYYSLQGVRVAADALQPGIYIKRVGTEATKILISK